MDLDVFVKLWPVLTGLVVMGCTLAVGYAKIVSIDNAVKMQLTMLTEMRTYQSKLDERLATLERDGRTVERIHNPELTLARLALCGQQKA